MRPQMHEFAHLVDRSAQSLQPVLILIAITSWILALVGQISAYRSRKPGSPRRMSGRFLIGMFIFAGIIGGEFAIDALIKSAALQEIKPKLSNNIEAVTVNGNPYDSANGLIADLRAMHDIMAHHSHPTRGYQLILKTSGGPLSLQLCRDSDNPHEYWVFYPEYYSTKSNEVGRVFTNALDGF
jgi:hypothetical protein